MQIDRSVILQAKEKLGDDNASIIVEELGITDYDEKNMRCRCPFHRENHASFIYNKKAYNFTCFGACGRSYDLIDVFMYKGATYIEACRKLFEEAEIPYSFGEQGVKTKRAYIYPKEVPVGDKSKLYDYYAMRKISPATLDYADVRQDEQGNAVFNYYDTNDVLTMVKYRPTRKLKKGDNKCWCQKGADTTPLLFNMNRVNINSPLLICEGESDCLAAIESGFRNAVSVPLGSSNLHWIDENLDWLKQFDSLIICSDNDSAGYKMQEECVRRLGSSRTKIVQIPKFYLDKSTNQEWPVNDLNEVLFYYGKDTVLNIILTAKDTPVPGMIDFSDIKDRDLDSMGGIETGLSQLDSYLMKLFFGTLTILTGVNGSGKSSFLNQIICRCLDSGEKAYLFSGELPNFQSRNWLNFTFAGQRNVVECCFRNSVFYKVTPEAKANISEHYREMLYIRKDGESNKAADLLQSMEDVAVKHGSRLFILDNLTAINLDCNDNNKYDKQAEFIAQLISFAVQYDVAVILVVHPHKIETMRRLSKMDVQGISAIIDLAHRIVSLYRIRESDRSGKRPMKGDVMIDILKDRLTGYENVGIEVFYDKPSRRFFTSLQDLDTQYKWDKKHYTTPIPFMPKCLTDMESEAFGVC